VYWASEGGFPEEQTVEQVFLQWQGPLRDAFSDGTNVLA